MYLEYIYKKNTFNLSDNVKDLAKDLHNYDVIDTENPAIQWFATTCV